MNGKGACSLITSSGVRTPITKSPRVSWPRKVKIMSLEGQQLGRYRLLKLIGSGGMGEVYLAHDQGFKRLVAIKVVRTGMPTHSSADTSMEAIRLFQRETKTIPRLDHAGILPLYYYVK